MTLKYGRTIKTFAYQIKISSEKKCLNGPFNPDPRFLPQVPATDLPYSNNRNNNDINMKCIKDVLNIDEPVGNWCVDDKDGRWL